MRDPLRVRVNGLLAPFVPGFAAELGRQGCACVSVVHQVQLVAHLSRWMARMSGSASWRLNASSSSLCRGERRATGTS